VWGPSFHPTFVPYVPDQHVGHRGALHVLTGFAYCSLLSFLLMNILVWAIAARSVKLHIVPWTPSFAP